MHAKNVIDLWYMGEPLCVGRKRNQREAAVTRWIKAGECAKSDK